MLNHLTVWLWRPTTPHLALHVGGIGIALLLCGSLASAEQEPSPASSSSEHHGKSSLAYVSDFFAFVGRDTSGHVAFALDNNRGRDGDTWQTEHLLVLLHDEQKGWQELAGVGPYQNTEKKLFQIPNSPYFQFTGDSTTGLTIQNSENELTLEISPVKERVQRKDGDSLYRMGSSSAIMKWQGRTLPGWIIHERLEMADFNRLTRQYFDLWTESYGLYAWAEESPDFLYFHQQADETRLTPLVGNLVGYAVLNNEGEHLHHLQLTVLDSTPAWGFYEWPQGWGGQWTGQEGIGSMSMHVSDLQVISNFILGGLAMGIIHGEITYNGKVRQIYGMAELLL